MLGQQVSAIQNLAKHLSTVRETLVESHWTKVMKNCTEIFNLHLVTVHETLFKSQWTKVMKNCT